MPINPRRQRGFTLVELIIVIVITGILAGALTVFMKPAVEAYFDSRRRAELTDIADTALRKMAQDIRRAVPNSLRVHSAGCLQLVPSTAGGRYRLAADPAGGSAWLDPTTKTSKFDVPYSFDVLTALSSPPSTGDWVVINNQNGSDVYSGSNRGQVDSMPATSFGQHRIKLSTDMQFPAGYEEGRFLIVSNSAASVFYHCVGNRLYRTTGTFADGSASCTSTSGATLATDIESCAFTYEVGATERSGLLWLQLQLLRDGERVTLAHGTHVDNVP